MTFSLIGPDALDALCKLAEGSPEGCWVEVGVYQGGSAARLYRLAEAQGRVLHLYDTFCGTPHACELDKHVVGDFSNTSIAQVRQACPKAEIWPGIFPSTLTDEVRNIAFGHIDCDQYQSVLDTTLALFPRLVKGGILCYDDWPHLEGARAAILECFTVDKLHQLETGQVFIVKG